MSNIDVAALPRRTAHATHALLARSRDLHMPVTAREVQLYDEEAASTHQTSRGLIHARRLGLAHYVSTGRLWLPSGTAQDLRGPLEDRYLADTQQTADQI